MTKKLSQLQPEPSDCGGISKKRYGITIVDAMPLALNKNCESCLMPFDKDTGVRESERYCSLCYKDGKLCYEGNDLKEFQRECYTQIRKHGTHLLAAKFFTFMIRFAPRWKK